MPIVRTRPHPISLCLLALTLLTAPARAADPPAAAEHDYAFSVVWGGFGSTQLINSNELAAFWSLSFDFPIVRAWGLDAAIGVDNAVFGDPDDALSALIQPARSGYQLGLGFTRLPSDWRIWYFHVSDHNVTEIAPRVNNDFVWTVGTGGLSDMLLLEKPLGNLLIGGGPAFASRHTNMIPRILGIDGVLLTAVQSSGAIGYLRHEFRWGTLEGKAGALAIINGTDEDRFIVSGEGLDSTLVRVKYSRSQMAGGLSLTHSFSDFGLTGTVFWGSFDAAISLAARWRFGLVID